MRKSQHRRPKSIRGKRHEEDKARKESKKPREESNLRGKKGLSVSGT